MEFVVIKLKKRTYYIFAEIRKNFDNTFDNTFYRK